MPLEYVWSALFRRLGTIDLTTSIAVIGDSHTRSYACNSAFTPLFIGPGKENNFIDEASANTYLKRATKVLQQLRVNTVLLLFGEPDARYSLGCGWYPWDHRNETSGQQRGPKFDPIPHVERMERVYNKLAERFSSTTFFVPTIHPVGFEAENVPIKALNDALRYRMSDVIIDVWDRLYINDRAVPGLLADQVHATDYIQKPVFEKICEKKVLSILFAERDASVRWNAAEIQKRFKYNSRFKCFTMK